MDQLAALSEWYRAQCDGDWEHRYGVRIETCDNPGWIVRIDLTGTALASRPFAPIADHIGADGHPVGSRWLDCSVESGVWRGAGDESKLTAILDAFLTWAAQPA